MTALRAQSEGIAVQPGMARRSLRLLSHPTKMVSVNGIRRTAFDLRLGGDKVITPGLALPLGA